MAEYAYVAKDTIADPAATAIRGYVFGGTTGPSVALRDTERVLASSSGWQAKAEMPPSSGSATGRQTLAASEISGKGYVYGGYDGAALDDVDQYTVSTDAWAERTALGSARYSMAASTIGAKGYVYGGYNGSAYIRECDEFNAAGNSWADKANMPTPARSELAGATIGLSGFVFGGWDGSTLYADTDRYSQTANVWSSKSDMLLDARQRLMATRVGESIYVLGGVRPGTPYGDMDKYSVDTWVPQTALLSDRYGGGAFTIDTDVYTVAGLSPITLSDCDKYDGASWTNHSTLAGDARYNVASCAI